MFYHFLYPLSEYWGALNVFKYITFRAMGSSVTAFLFCMIFGNVLIRLLKRLNVVESTKRDHAPQLDPMFEHKESVPSMGGLILLVAIVLANILWGNFESKYMLFVLIVISSLGFVGFVDDFVKIRAKNSQGIPAIIKLAGQLVIGICLAIFLYNEPGYQRIVYFPFVKSYVLTLGYLFIPFSVLVIVGTSNALNITDGLDGLAIGCTIIAAAAFSLICYITGHREFADYLNIAYIAQSGELAVFCASLVGAGVGFLWFNSYPAQVFMGDTGALSMGGAIGAVALFIKKELLLLIIGGIFVWEVLSVIIQVISFKLTGKRVFLCAPYHHHLQLKGWHEAKITVRLCIVAFILAVIGLSTLKLM